MQLGVLLSNKKVNFSRKYLFFIDKKKSKSYNRLYWPTKNLPILLVRLPHRCACTRVTANRDNARPRDVAVAVAATPAPHRQRRWRRRWRRRRWWWRWRLRRRWRWRWRRLRLRRRRQQQRWRRQWRWWCGQRRRRRTASLIVIIMPPWPHAHFREQHGKRACVDVVEKKRDLWHRRDKRRWTTTKHDDSNGIFLTCTRTSRRGCRLRGGSDRLQTTRSYQRLTFLPVDDVHASERARGESS